MGMQHRLAFALALLGAAGTVAEAQTAGAFDGSWQTVLACNASEDGASGYTVRFTSIVRRGIFHGERGVSGQPGFLSVDGSIMPDGSALLLATGLTNDPRYNVAHVGPGRPVLYHLQSQFEGSHGSGSRVELRHCDAVFSRQ